MCARILKHAHALEAFAQKLYFISRKCSALIFNDYMGKFPMTFVLASETICNSNHASVYNRISHNKFNFYCISLAGSRHHLI